MLSQYYTGKPCKRGHIAPRNTNSCNCHECWREDALRTRDADRPAHRALKAREYQRNKQAILAQQKKYRERNWADIYAKRKANSSYVDYMRRYSKEYHVTSPSDQTKATHAANARYRQAMKLLRTPPWVTSTERSQIASLYLQARQLTKETGIQHVVDHIIPLQGKLVSGLHCLANLQILTAAANRVKWNHFLDSDSSTSP